jgi:hypothetical protein
MNGARIRAARPERALHQGKDSLVLAGSQRVVPHFGTSNRPTKEARTAARFTISLPVDIADYLRARSEELQEPVSGLIADAIRCRQAAELERAMIEGLMEDAERDRALASEWSVTLPDLPD